MTADEQFFRSSAERAKAMGKDATRDEVALRISRLVGDYVEAVTKPHAGLVRLATKDLISQATPAGKTMHAIFRLMERQRTELLDVMCASDDAAIRAQGTSYVAAVGRQIEQYATAVTVIDDVFDKGA